MADVVRVVNMSDFFIMGGLAIVLAVFVLGSELYKAQDRDDE